jgi:hypothetical protein
MLANSPMVLVNAYDRRIPVLYQLPTVSDSSYRTAYVQAVSRIFWSSSRRSLYPIDWDYDYVLFGRRLGAIVWTGNPPDFYSYPSSFCSLDEETAERASVALTDEIAGNRERYISGVPERMTRSLIDLYNRAVQNLESQLTTTPPDQQGAIRAEIRQLQDQIHTLQAFLDSLS